MTPSATKARGGRQARTRDDIIKALKRYAELYGDDFTASAFSPSTAKWRDEAWLIDRYLAGDPQTGERWPSLNAIKAPFGGSFNAAREAAGMAANKPGPARGRRASGEHAPVRDVRHVTRTIYREKDAGEARRRAEARADRLEAKVERLEEQLQVARRRKPKTKTKTKTVVVREKDLGRLTAAKAQAKEARAAATRMAARLERAEATINSLRAEKADLKAERLRLSVAARKALDRAEQLEAAGAEIVEVEVVREVERVVERVVEKPAPEQAVVDAALRDAMLARREADSAGRRAAESDQAYFELAAAVKGEQRRLTKAELAELRRAGPAGPAVMAAALKRVAGARAGKDDMAAALTAVASAALTWRDRL